VGYYGGLAVAVRNRPHRAALALFIAAVPVLKVLTNTALPPLVGAVGELLEGAAKPVGSDAEGVIHLKDQRRTPTKVIKLSPRLGPGRSRR
jgi:hypothetical protein